MIDDLELLALVEKFEPVSVAQLVDSAFYFEIFPEDLKIGKAIEEVNDVLGKVMERGFVNREFHGGRYVHKLTDSGRQHLEAELGQTKSA